MNPINLWFRNDGTIQGLYTEVVDLQALGRLAIKRISRIEYDNRLQAWRVLDRRGRSLYVSPSREICLRWEWQYINWKLDDQSNVGPKNQGG